MFCTRNVFSEHLGSTWTYFRLFYRLGSAYRLIRWIYIDGLPTIGNVFMPFLIGWYLYRLVTCNRLRILNPNCLPLAMVSWGSDDSYLLDRLLLFIGSIGVLFLGSTEVRSSGNPGTRSCTRTLWKQEIPLYFIGIFVLKTRSSFGPFYFNFSIDGLELRGISCSKPEI